jgi:hypothetical protein
MVTPRRGVRLNGGLIGGDFWSITGVKPALGRLFGPEERGAVVLTWDVFQREFSGDPAIVEARL